MWFYGMGWDGYGWNEMKWNGMEWNGMKRNGMKWNETFFISSIYAWEGYRLLGSSIWLLETKWWAFRNLILFYYGCVFRAFHRTKRATNTMKRINSVLYMHEKVIGSLKLARFFGNRKFGVQKLNFVRLWTVGHVLCAYHRNIRATITLKHIKSDL